MLLIFRVLPSKVPGQVAGNVRIGQNKTSVNNLGNEPRSNGRRSGNLPNEAGTDDEN